MPEPLVTLEGVSKEYRTGASPVHALRDVWLSLPPGVLCVVHGRSGSGKTTLLTILGGLETGQAQAAAPPPTGARSRRSVRSSWSSTGATPSASSSRRSG